MVQSRGFCLWFLHGIWPLADARGGAGGLQRAPRWLRIILTDLLFSKSPAQNTAPGTATAREYIASSWLSRRRPRRLLGSLRFDFRVPPFHDRPIASQPTTQSIACYSTVMINQAAARTSRIRDALLWSTKQLQHRIPCSAQPPIQAREPGVQDNI